MLLIADMVGVDEAAVTAIDHRVMPFVNRQWNYEPFILILHCILYCVEFLPHNSEFMNSKHRYIYTGKLQPVSGGAGLV